MWQFDNSQSYLSPFGNRYCVRNRVAILLLVTTKIHSYNWEQINYPSSSPSLHPSQKTTLLAVQNTLHSELLSNHTLPTIAPSLQTTLLSTIYKFVASLNGLPARLWRVSTVLDLSILQRVKGLCARSFPYDVKLPHRSARSCVWRLCTCVHSS